MSHATHEIKANFLFKKKLFFFCRMETSLPQQKQWQHLTWSADELAPLSASYLPRGWDEQAEAVYGDVDRNAHACKSQVTLPHHGLQSFVQGLKERWKHRLQDKRCFVWFWSRRAIPCFNDWPYQTEWLLCDKDVTQNHSQLIKPPCVTQ